MCTIKYFFEWVSEICLTLMATQNMLISMVSWFDVASYPGPPFSWKKGEGLGTRLGFDGGGGGEVHLTNPMFLFA